MMATTMRRRLVSSSSLHRHRFIDTPTKFGLTSNFSQNSYREVAAATANSVRKRNDEDDDELVLSRTVVSSSSHQSACRTFQPRTLSASTGSWMSTRITSSKLHQGGRHVHNHRSFHSSTVYLHQSFKKKSPSQRMRSRIRKHQQQSQGQEQPHQTGYIFEDPERNSTAVDHANRSSANISSSSNSQSDSSVNATSSQRLEFHQVPVDPQVLEYIQRIGVGIPPRNRHAGKRRLSINKGKNDKKSFHRSDDDDDDDIYHHDLDVMNRFEELQAFGMTGGHNRSSSRSRGGRMSSGSNRSLRASSSDRPGDDDVDATNPPLPFGHRHTSRRKDIQTEIKILRSVGAIHNDDGHDFSQEQSAEKDSSTSPSSAASTLFPRPSKYIPEIALMGRSNVGKSTLLNALLHGEVRPEPEEDLDNNIRHRRQRHTTTRKTTQTAKLPPGIKAVTSSRPGETRQITFYQLSSRQRRQKGRDNNDSILEAFAPSDSEDNNDEKDNPGTVTNNRKQQSTTSPISLMLVDLPGYGFAYGTGSGGSVSGKGTRGDDAGYSSSHDWQIPLIERFLLERVLPRKVDGGGSSLSNPSSSLKRILLLLDARHGMKKADVDFLNSLQDKIYYAAASSDGGGNNREKQNTIKKKVELPPIQIVLTKCDLVPQADLARRAVLVRCQLSEILRREAGSLPVMMVSAQMRGQGGLLELQRELAALVVHNNRKG